MAQRHIPTSVGSLHVLAQDSSPHVSIWAIHALCVTINEAGMIIINRGRAIDCFLFFYYF